MIGLTRPTGERCHLDPNWIQRVEAHPETVVHLTGGARYPVVEAVDQVVALIRKDRASVIAACYVLDRGKDPDPFGVRGHDEAAPSRSRYGSAPWRHRG